MKHFLGCLALSALSALSGTAGGSGAPLRIYTEFRMPPDPAVDTAMQSELASLVSPIGLDVEWRSLSNPNVGETSVALVVVAFVGRCDVVGLQPRREPAGPLAWTHISDGIILPFVDVDCERLRGLLQSRLLASDDKDRPRLLGRAMARVLGHELYHVFVETRRHDRGGLAQPAFSAAELLSDNFDFGEKEFRDLRSSKLRALLAIRKPIEKALLGVRAEYKADSCASCHGASGEGTRWAPPLQHANSKTLMTRFDKKREEMYRRARSLNVAWQFPTEEEVAEIVSELDGGTDHRR